jgi:hypothetical protein
MESRWGKIIPFCEKAHLGADNILLYLKYHTNQWFIIKRQCWLDCVEHVMISNSVWLDENYVAPHHNFHSQKQASFVYRSIHVRYRFTLVYTPGRWGNAHPSPQDTTPAIHTSLSSILLYCIHTNYYHTSKSFIHLLIHLFIHSCVHPVNASMNVYWKLIEGTVKWILFFASYEGARHIVAFNQLSIIYCSDAPNSSEYN